MNRRQFLITGAVSLLPLLGGCTAEGEGTNATLSMTLTSDLDIAERLTYDLDEKRDSDAVAIEAVADGEATVEATRNPFPEETPFIYEDSVYELSVIAEDEVSATTFEFTLDEIAEEESIREEEVIRYGELPEVDQYAFSGHGWDQSDPHLGYGSTVRYLDAQISDSAIVPEPETPIIDWPEARGRISIEGSEPTPITTFKYEPRVVADSAVAYGRAARERSEFEIANLSESEREIVSEAIREGVYTVPEDESVPEAMTELARRFRGERNIARPDREPERTQSPDGNYVTRYEDRRYWAHLYLRNEGEIRSS